MFITPATRLPIVGVQKELVPPKSPRIHTAAGLWGGFSRLEFDNKLKKNNPSNDTPKGTHVFSRARATCLPIAGVQKELVSPKRPEDPLGRQIMGKIFEIRVR